MITVVENLGWNPLIKFGSHLQIPMYSFSITGPLLTSAPLLSLPLICWWISGWTTQSIHLMNGPLNHSFTLLCFFFAVIEGVLLTGMVYDCFKGTKFHYTVTVSLHLDGLVLATYLAGFVNAAICTGFNLRLTFCCSTVTSHFLLGYFNPPEPLLFWHTCQ